MKTRIFIIVLGLALLLLQRAAQGQFSVNSTRGLVGPGDDLGDEDENPAWLCPLSLPARIPHDLRRHQTRTISMNSGNEDKIKGTAKEAIGKVKEKTGEAIGNPDLRDRGTAEKVEGKVQDKVGDIKKVFEK